jgi:signal recognition particle GTPase
MISNKNKVIITVLAILGAVVLMVVMFNKMNMVKKVEKFVDDDSDVDVDDNIEAYEDVDAGADLEAEEDFAEDAEDEEPKPKKKDEKKADKKEADKKEEKKGASNDDKKTQSNVATKLKQFIDTVDKEINAKEVSDDIKNKVMKDLMSNITSLQDMGVSASKVVTDTINKYAPPKSTYVDAPVVTRSMDTVKGYLKAALSELEAMSGKEAFNERFTPSRSAPTPLKKVEPMTEDETTTSKDAIEGFENAPRYALY